MMTNSTSQIFNRESLLTDSKKGNYIDMDGFVSSIAYLRFYLLIVFIKKN